MLKHIAGLCLGLALLGSSLGCNSEPTISTEEEKKASVEKMRQDMQQMTLPRNPTQGQAPPAQ